MRFFRAATLALLMGTGCGSTELPTSTPDAGAPDLPAPPIIVDQADASAGEDRPARGPADGPDKGGTRGDPDAGKVGGGGDTQSAPGTPVRERATSGQGACAGKSLAEVIAAVHQQMPALADITVLEGMDPNLGGDGNRIFAFTGPQGFSLVFKRGAGDCPAGCIDNEYWYFGTDKACRPDQVGHYLRAYASPGNCFKIEGKPLWGIPAPIDPVHVCGADNTPQKIAGTYNLRAQGTRTACTALAGDEPQVKVSLELVLMVTQMPELSKGTVTVAGTGNPRLDGVVLPATFTRKRLAVAVNTDVPSTCLDQTMTTIELDLEANRPGKLTFFEARALDCPPSQTYCKGQLALDLMLK